MCSTPPRFPLSSSSFPVWQLLDWRGAMSYTGLVQTRFHFSCFQIKIIIFPGWGCSKLSAFVNTKHTCEDVYWWHRTIILKRSDFRQVLLLTSLLYATHGQYPPDAWIAARNNEDILGALRKCDDTSTWPWLGFMTDVVVGSLWSLVEWFTTHYRIHAENLLKSYVVKRSWNP